MKNFLSKFLSGKFLYENASRNSSEVTKFYLKNIIHLITFWVAFYGLTYSIFVDNCDYYNSNIVSSVWNSMWLPVEHLSQSNHILNIKDIEPPIMKPTIFYIVQSDTTKQDSSVNQILKKQIVEDLSTSPPKLPSSAPTNNWALLSLLAKMKLHYPDSGYKNIVVYQTNEKDTIPTPIMEIGRDRKIKGLTDGIKECVNSMKKNYIKEPAPLSGLFNWLKNNGNAGIINEGLICNFIGDFCPSNEKDYKKLKMVLRELSKYGLV